jgi:hypothetical protein
MPRENSAATGLALPRKHLNGGNWERLTRQYHDAYAAINTAFRVLSFIDFHARDYYIIDDEAFLKAQAVRDRQFDDLSRIRAELLAHVENGLEQDPTALD